MCNWGFRDMCDIRMVYPESGKDKTRLDSLVDVGMHEKTVWMDGRDKSCCQSF